MRVGIATDHGGFGLSKVALLELQQTRISR